MNKTWLILFLCSLVISACAGTHSTTKSEQTFQWAVYYDRQATEWRMDGIDSMADYYELRAEEEREKQNRSARGILNLFFRN